MPEVLSPAAQRGYDLKRKRAFGDMIKTEGWKFYEELLNNHIGTRSQVLLDKLEDGVNASLRQEYDKGAMYGLILARDIPSVTIQSMDNVSDSSDLPVEE